MADDIIKLDRDALKALITEAVTEALEVAEIVTTEDLNEFAAELTEGGVLDQLDDDRDTPDPLPKRPILEVREPEPEPEPKGRRIDPDRLFLSIDPDDQRTWGPRRTNETQIVISGAVFNYASPGQNPWVDRIAGQGRQWNQSTLSFADGDHGPELHSWPLLDGSTLRHGVIEANGRKWLRFASQFTGEGYNPKDERKLKTGPGGSDPLFHDGCIRGQYSKIGGHVRIGPGARPLIMATEFRVDEWMLGKGHCAAPFEIHAPLKATQSGVITGSIREGQLLLWSKTSGPNSDPSPLDFPGRQPSGRDHLRLATIDLPAVGESITVITEFVSDQSGQGESYCHTFVVDRAGDLRQVGGFDGPYGYYYRDNQKSGEAYINAQQIYRPRQYWPPKRYPATPWNRDPNVSDVHRLDSAFFAAAWAEDVSLEEMAAHAVSFR